MEYILEHSGAKLIIVDYEFANLVHGTNLPVILSHDTGRFGDPYEDFLAHGRAFSNERGWEGLDLEPDENTNCALNYTCVFSWSRPCLRVSSDVLVPARLDGYVRLRSDRDLR